MTEINITREKYMEIKMKKAIKILLVEDNPGDARIDTRNVK